MLQLTASLLQLYETVFTSLFSVHAKPKRLEPPLSVPLDKKQTSGSI
jgi:hypothetical protein